MKSALPGKGEDGTAPAVARLLRGRTRIPQSLVSGVLQPQLGRGRMPRPGHARRADPVQAHRRQGLRDRGSLPAPRRAALGAPGVLHQEHHQLLVSRLHLRPSRRQAGRHHHRPRKPADRQNQAQVLSGRGAQEPGVRLHRRRDAASDSRSTCSRASSTTISRSIPNGEHEIVKSNWRLAAENGVDASHIYIHRNSALINAARRPLPLSSYFLTREGMVVDQDGAPKGVVKGVGPTDLRLGDRDRGREDRKPIPARRQHRSAQRHRHLAVAALRPQGRSVPAARHHPIRMVRAAGRTVAPLHRHLGSAGGRRARNASSSSARWT